MNTMKNTTPSQPASKINRLLVFGDSLLDTGNLRKMSPKSIAPPDYYYKGRFSNGPNIADYLDQMLDVPMENYAVGGAMLEGNNKKLLTYTHGKDVSIITQIRNFPGKFKNTDLVLVNGGSNDIFAHWFFPNLPNKWNDIIQALQDKGVKNLIVINVSDVTFTPIIRSHFITRYFIANFMRPNIKKGNQVLAQNIADLQRMNPSMHSVLFDFYRYSDQLLQHLPTHTIINKGCIDAVGGMPKTLKKCNDPSKHIFWDMIHPTTKYQKKAAKAIYNQWIETNK